MSASHDSPGVQLPTTATSGTIFLVLIQVISRGLTFLSNQAILLNISPEILGVAAQLELYSITILYFSREFIRTAIQRQPLSIVHTATQPKNEAKVPVKGREIDQDGIDPTASQTIVNMSYLSLVLGVPLTIILGASYLRFSTDQVIHIPYLQIGLKIVCISCIVELGTEPFFAIIQQHLLYKTRAIVETVAAVSRSFVICFMSVWSIRSRTQVGILPFACGHMAYAVALLLGYMCIMVYKRNFNFSFFLKPLQAR